VNVAHAWIRLRRTGTRIAGVGRMLVPLLAAAAASGAVMLGGAALFGLSGQEGRLVLLLQTAVVGLAGVAAFGGVAVLLGLDDLRRLRRGSAAEPGGQDQPPRA
jgi:hypothetical protein